KTAPAEDTATLEGGLIAETKTRVSKKGSRGGRVNIKFADASLTGDNESEHNWTVADAPGAQFERLLAAGNEDPEAIGWIDVMDPASDFASAKIGEFISWECDVYVPTIFRVISSSGEAHRNLGLAENLLETMKSAA